ADQAGEIARRSEGSPLLAMELVRVTVLGGDARAAASCADAVTARAARLSPVALDAVRLLALCAAPLPIEIIAQALGMESDEASRLASLLAVLGFACVAGGRGGETLELAHRAFAEPLLRDLEPAAAAQ